MRLFHRATVGNMWLQTRTNDLAEIVVRKWPWSDPQTFRVLLYPVGWVYEDTGEFVGLRIHRMLGVAWERARADRGME